jgi:hypothetical protein
VKRAAVAIETMAARDPSGALPCDDTEDMGLGEEEHEEVWGGAAYRTIERPLRVIRGAPERAKSAMKRAVARSLALAMVGWAGALVTMLPMPMPMP